VIRLEITKRTDKRLLDRMETHYSKPRGFVGRNICYAIYFDDVYYGHIVGGSSTLHLVGRHEYLGTSREDLNSIVNNLFYNVSKVNGKYPCRNFTSRVLKEFMKVICIDWRNKYGDTVIGFETLIEPPRSGECYRRSGFEFVGMTKGYTCKRVKGKGTDKWSGSRVWDTKNLRPKLVMCCRVGGVK